MQQYSWLLLRSSEATYRATIPTHLPGGAPGILRSRGRGGGERIVQVSLADGHLDQRIRPGRLRQAKEGLTRGHIALRGTWKRYGRTKGTWGEEARLKVQQSKGKSMVRTDKERQKVLDTNKKKVQTYKKRYTGGMGKGKGTTAKSNGT